MKRRGESGFALLFVFVLAAAIAIALYMEIPRVAFESQRFREQQLIDRGEQYKRAIQLFYRKYRTYPQNLDDLETTRNIRFLRRRYKDPMTGKDEWRLIHVGPGGVLTDSLIQPANPAGKDKDKDKQTADGSQPGGDSGQPGQAGEGVNMALRRPSDRVVGEGPGGGDQSGNPDDPNQPQYPQAPQYGQPQYPGQPGQPAYPGQPGYPGQPQYPGQPGQPAYPGQPQYPGQPVYPGQPGYPTQPGQPAYPGQPQYPGQPVYPGQPGYPAQPGQPAYPGQPQYPGQPGYPVQPQYPGQPGQPGQPYSYPLSPPPGAPPGTYPIQPQPGQPYNPNQPYPNQPYNPNQPYTPQPYPGQGTPGAGGPTPFGNPSQQNQATGLIQTILTTPRQPPSGMGLSGGGTGLAGVASTAKGQGIHVVNERKKYREWEFVYDLKKDKSSSGLVQQQQQLQQMGMPGVGAQPGLQPGVGTQPGMGGMQPVPGPTKPPGQ